MEQPWIIWVNTSHESSWNCWYNQTKKRQNKTNSIPHDDVIKWKHFPRYWPFVRGIHQSPVNSPHKGHWCGALMFSLICVWINGWVNNRQAGDLRRCRTNFDVIVMKPCAHFKRYRVSPALSSSGEVLEDSGRDWKVNSGLSCHGGLTLADSRLTGPWRLPLLALVWHWNHSILGQIDMGRIWNLRFIV